MSFKIVCDTLNARVNTVRGIGPTGFKQFLKRLGAPQDKLNIIHIAGTNGKGSVAYLTESVFRASGCKTGLFISPHLSEITERIQINGKPVSKVTFTKALEKVFQAEEKKLNFFEALTAAAFLIFSEAKIQYVVLETGLGGRKDPTNACLPKAVYITSIDKDHTALLGGSVRQISAEKAGIIKLGVPCFCGETKREALQEIKKMAAAKKAPLYLVKDNEPWRVKKFNFLKNNTLLSDGRRSWLLHVLGEKQAANANGVYQLASYFNLSEKAVRQGFKQVVIPARYEVIKMAGASFFLDGAHNPKAVENLISFLKQTPFYKNSVLLCAVMKDKDYPSMLKLLAPHFKTVIFTQVNSGRGAGEKEIVSALPPRTNYRFYSNWQEALRHAGQYKKVVCCGSFHLAGVVRREIVGR